MRFAAGPGTGDAQFTSNGSDPFARDDRLGDGKPLSNAAPPDAGRPRFRTGAEPTALVKEGINGLIRL
jgi:hypothetical protein